MKRILLLEPPGGYIRLDRCMQNTKSWGGVFRFPLGLARIAAHMLSIGHSVQVIDCQADLSVDLRSTLLSFKPDICILSTGFPSMKHDSQFGFYIKSILPNVHVSTFGVVPTLLNKDLFLYDTWGFQVPFDSIVLGGEPALGYEKLISENLADAPSVIEGTMQRTKTIQTSNARYLFNHRLYKSPFTGQNATYVEGTYGCPYRCSFCVVPELYNSNFSHRTSQDIVNEIQFVIENNNINQITLWDEGTTFNKKYILELCIGLAELRKSKINKFKNFTWTTRSTTALLDEEVVEGMARSGLSGITLGIESFDENVINSIEKNISLESNNNAISLLSKFGVISIGHIILGHINDSKESIERTIEATVNSNLNFAQFYCAVPYPGTKLHATATQLDLIRVQDLTKYELCNPIMDTINGLSHVVVGKYREKAIKKFWTDDRWEQLDKMSSNGYGLSNSIKAPFLSWVNKQHKEISCLY